MRQPRALCRIAPGFISPCRQTWQLPSTSARCSRTNCKRESRWTIRRARASNRLPPRQATNFGLRFSRTESIPSCSPVSKLPRGIQLSLTDDSGNPLGNAFLDDGQQVLIDIAPGTYRLVVSGWDPSLGNAVAYHLRIGLQTVFDNPPPLVSGPAPALVLHFENTTVTGPAPVFDSGGSNFGPPPDQSGTGTSAGGPQGSLDALTGTGTALTAGLSGLAIGTGSLAFLASEPVGGVASSAQVAAEPATLQLALSTTGSPGQGLLSLLVMTLTGTMYPPVSQPPEPQDGILSGQIADQAVGRSGDLQASAAGNAEAARAAGALSQTAIKAGDKSELTVGSDERDSGATSPAVQMAEAPLMDDRETTVVQGSFADIAFTETSERLAGLLPDWLGYVAAVGILVLSQWKTARGSWWSAKSEPECSLGRHRVDHPGSRPASPAPHAAGYRPGWFRRRHGTRHSVVSPVSE